MYSKNKVSKNEIEIIEKIFYEKVCGLEPDFIEFLKTCDIKVLEDAWKYRNAVWLNNKDTPDDVVKDWIRRMKSWISCFSEYRKRFIEVEISEDEYFFKSKKYPSIIEAAKDCGVSYQALTYAVENNKFFVRSRKNGKVVFLRKIQ